MMVVCLRTPNEDQLRRSRLHRLPTGPFGPRRLVQGSERSRQTDDVGDEPRRLGIGVRQADYYLKGCETLDLLHREVTRGSSIEEVGGSRQSPRSTRHLVCLGEELPSETGQVQWVPCPPLQDLSERPSLTRSGRHALTVQRVEVADGVPQGDQPLWEALELLEMAAHRAGESKRRRVCDRLRRSYQLVPDGPGEGATETRASRRGRLAGSRQIVRPDPPTSCLLRFAPGRRLDCCTRSRVSE